MRRWRLAEGSTGLSFGLQAARRGDWDAAVRAWKEVADHGTGRRKSKAEHNLAVAQEILGDRAKAMLLAAQATQTRDSRLTRGLQRRLDVRASEDGRVQKQLECR